MVDEKMVLRLYCRTAVNIMNAGHDIIPSTVVADICGCSLYRARKIIKKLVDMGLLESAGEGGWDEEQPYIMRGYRLTRQGRKSKQYAKAQWDEAKICSKCFGGGSPYSYFKGFRSSTNLTEEGEKNAQNDRKKSTEEMNMTELAYNCMYAKDGWAWYRDFETDMDLRDFIREFSAAEGTSELPSDNDELGEELLDDLQYGIDYAPGRVALMYRLMWALADMREALMRYEDTGLTPDQIEALLEERKWIPVAEQLPEIGEPVLVTLWDRDVTIGTWYGHRWGTALYYSEDVLAWMPKPENYRPAD